MDALDPVYQEAVSSRQAPSRYFTANSSRMADALLGVTDRRAAESKRPVLRATYDKLRPAAKRHVEAAAPGIAALVERHVPSGE